MLSKRRYSSGSSRYLTSQSGYSKYATAPRGFTVSHREYLGDLITSGSANTFTSQSFPLNPGQAATFPWLSGIADQFEEYHFNSLNFEFISTSADALNSANTALGTVLIAGDYNAANPTYITKAQMENSMLSISGKPSMDLKMPVDCSRRNGNPLSNLYVRTGLPAASQDIRFFDLGFVQFATTGFQGTSVNVGEMWVNYTITLSKPILLNIPATLQYTPSVSHYIGSGTFSSSYPFGSVDTALYVPNGGVSLLFGLSAYNTQSVQFNIGFPQTFILFFSWYSAVGGTPAAFVDPTWTFNNCTKAVVPSTGSNPGKYFLNTNGSSIFDTSAQTYAASSNQCTCAIAINITNTLNVASLAVSNPSSMVFPNSGTSCVCDIWCFVIPSTLWD